MEKNVPKKPRRLKNNPIWMTKRLKKMLKKKEKAWNDYKKNKNPEKFAAYKKLEKSVQKGVKNSKKRFEKKLAYNQKNDKSFNSYLKSRMKVKTTVGPLKNDKKEPVVDSQSMAEMLNTYFISVFTKEEGTDIPVPDSLPAASELNSVTFTSSEVSKKIEKMKIGSPGPDGITVNFLKATQQVISEPLALIFTKSMNEGSVPLSWREANVTPIFKKGSKTETCNYRPVSLTSVVCKLMETIIRDQLIQHLEINALINPTQHGFMKHKSCTTNLLEFFEVLTRAVDDNIPADLIYLDFAKAFDKVAKKRLLAKLEAHSIRKDVKKWIEAWLTGRKQRVVINGHASSWLPVESGVPQGSVLGPILFVLFINDIDLSASSSTLVRKFADDTKLGQILKDLFAHIELQNSLNNLVEWSETWNMQFNAKKCKVIHIGKNNPNHQYSMQGHILESVSEERDVGVMIHNSLKPSTQCAKAAKRANQVLGHLCRVFHYRDEKVFLSLYKKYVRCHLEYASPAWSPWTKQDIDTLEQVQKRAIKRISGLEGTYEEKLAKLNLQTLSERRVRQDMIQTYKILNGIDHVEANQWFTLAAEESVRVTRQSSDPFNIKPQKSKTDVRKYFFSNRVVANWNNLPSTIKQSVNTDQFKRSYDKYIRESVTVNRLQQEER